MVISVTWQSIPTLKSWFPLLLHSAVHLLLATEQQQQEDYYSSKVKLSYFPFTVGKSWKKVQFSEDVVGLRVIYDRVRKRKNYFLQNEGGKFKTSKENKNNNVFVFIWFWISCSWSSSFIIQKDGNFKIIFLAPYPIIYNPVITCKLAKYDRSAIFRQLCTDKCNFLIGWYW